MDLVTGSRFLGVLAVAALCGAVAVPVLRTSPLGAELRASGAWLAALVASVATAGSLWLSEGVGLEPCTLCWWQRGAMYPLVALLPALALTGSRALRVGVRLLAAAGLATSLWHVAVQHVPALSSATSCSSATPCSAALVQVFGFLTIPGMAASGFVAVLALTLLAPTEP